MWEKLRDEKQDGWKKTRDKRWITRVDETAKKTIRKKRNKREEKEGEKTKEWKRRRERIEKREEWVERKREKRVTGE
jgi:hypothetical protein